MTRLKLMLSGAVIAALGGLAGYGWAQTIAVFNATGNECWNASAGGPGGPSAGYICTFLTRNSEGTSTSTGAAAQTLTYQTSSLILTAQPASGANITLPSPAPDGMVVEVINGTTGAFSANVFSVVPNSGQTLVGGNVALTTLAAGTSREFRFVAATNTWYPIR